MKHDEPSRKGPLAALLIIIAMVAISLYISNRLREAATLQDCVASGRSNCAPIDPSGLR